MAAQFSEMTVDELIDKLITIAGRTAVSYSGGSTVGIMDVCEGSPVRKFLAVDIEDGGSITISGYDSQG